MLVQQLERRAEQAERGLKSVYRALARTAGKQRTSTPPFEADSAAGALADLNRLEERLLKRLADDEKDGPGTDIRSVAQSQLAEALGHVQQAAIAAESSHDEDERLHELRIAAKRLRYLVDVFQGVWPKPSVKRVLDELADVQTSLGEFNDQVNLIAWLEATSSRLAGAGDRAARVVSVERERLVHGREAAREKWRAFQSSKAWQTLRRWAKLGDASPSSPEPALIPSGLPVMVRKKTLQAAVGASLASRAGTTAPSNGNLVAPSRRNGAGGKVRLAAIDVGTNSVRLIIAESGPDGSYRVLDDEKEITRLGRGLHATGAMDPRAIEHTAVTVERMTQIAKGYGAEDLRVIATAAARDGCNSGDLTTKIRERTGLGVKIISAPEEAEYAYRSAARAFDLSSAPALVVDIGGGSTEIVLSVAGGQAARAGQSARAGVIERVFTVPVGAVRLAERFGGEPELSRDRFEELRKHARRVIREHVGSPSVVPQLVIGTGGTLTTLAAMVVLRDSEAGGNSAGSAGLFTGSVQGQQVTRADLRHMIDLVRKTPLKARARIPGLPADRADIILPGLVLMDAILKQFGCNTIRAHEGGIRDGLMLSMVAERFKGESPEPSDRAGVMRSVRRFARACSYERAHSEHVAELSLSIFDQLRASMGELRPAEREPTDRDRLILEAAAVLHDIGYLINYARHHKHSYHLILHAGLPGLTTREQAIVANVARYHRAADPKAGHAGFASLEPDDRELVRLLAGVLRVADGLDRTHTQSVKSVTVGISAGQLMINVSSENEPSVDVWGAHRKSGVLAKRIGREIAFDWVRQQGDAARARAGASAALAQV